MPKAIKVSTNFTAGEISPRLLGRTDLKKYQNGVRKLENFVPQVHGGIERRPGTMFVAEVWSDASIDPPPRLIEFQYNQEQSYVLEVGVNEVDDEGYIRFFRLDATTGDPILLTDPVEGDAPTIKSALNFTKADLPDMQFAQSADILYIFSENHEMRKLSRNSIDDDEATSWDYEVCVYNDGPYLPMNSDEDIYLKQAGSGGAGDSCGFSFENGAGLSVDVLEYDGALAANAQKDVGRLIRIEDDALGFPIEAFTAGTWDTTDPDAPLWDPPATITVGEDENEVKMYSLVGEEGEEGKRIEFLKVSFGIPELNDTVYIGRNFTEVTETSTKFDLYHPDTGEGIGFPYLVDDNPLLSANIDGTARYEKASHIGWGRIATITSASACTVTIEDETPNMSGSRTRNWRLGAWSETQGYPRTGRFYQNRLWSASSKTEPQTLWSSGTGAYNCYSPSTVREGVVLDESAITVTLSDSLVNKINFLEGDTAGLVVLTTGGEWLGRGTNPQSALTPTDLGFQKSSYYGSISTIHPLRAGTSVLFAQRDARVIRELTYEFGQDRFTAPNITLLSEHITKDGIIDSAYQSGVSNRLWYVRKDGSMLTMSYEKAEEVMGWAEHTLAPSAAGVKAEVLSVGVTLDDEIDNVWVLVKRDVDGTSKYYVEMLDTGLQSYEDHEYAFYVDCGVKGYSASPAHGWSGLLHLAGENVYVLGDGEEYGPYTVDAAGAIAMAPADASSRVAIGLKYTSVMETLPLIIDPSKGDTRGKLKRVYKVMANLYRSLGGKMGTPEQVYSVAYPTATSEELNTKMFEINIADNAQRETIIRFEQSGLQPTNLLSIVAEFQIGQF